LTIDEDVETVTGNLLYGIEIPEQGQVQNCSFLLEQQSKQNSMKMKQNNRTTNNTEYE
jgi:hypothetical protein